MIEANDPLRDFRNFLWLVWKFLNLPKPTLTQFSIATYLQHGPRRRTIMAFRGVGKSWITAAYVLWRLYVDPTLNILVVSASQRRADNFTKFCLQLIDEMPELAHLKPRGDQRRSLQGFDVGPAPPSQSPSVASAGITGMITGNRADEIVADDIEIPTNSETPAKREKIGESVKEFDAILKPNGRVTFLGTPQVDDSLYQILPERGYVIRRWPARYPTPDEMSVYGSEYDPDLRSMVQKTPSLVGHSVEPSRFTDRDLAERELSYGRSGFAKQFQLDTRGSSLDQCPLRLLDLLVFTLDSMQVPVDLVYSRDSEREWTDLPMVGLRGDHIYRPLQYQVDGQFRFTKPDRVFMNIDPSGRGTNETSYSVTALVAGVMVVFDIGGFLDGYEEPTLEALANLAKRWAVTHVKVEPNFGDGMFTRLLRPVFDKIHKVPIEDGKRAVGMKERRIVDLLEPMFNQHRVMMNATLFQKDFDSVTSYPVETGFMYRLFYQMTRLRSSKGCLGMDDRIDVLAQAAQCWAESMNIGVDAAKKKADDEEFEQEIRGFIAHATKQFGPGARGQSFGASRTVGSGGGMGFRSGAPKRKREVGPVKVWTYPGLPPPTKQS